jgi:hypothetical protein
MSPLSISTAVCPHLEQTSTLNPLSFAYSSTISCFSSEDSAFEQLEKNAEKIADADTMKKMLAVFRNLMI